MISDSPHPLQDIQVCPYEHSRCQKIYLPVIYDQLLHSLYKRQDTMNKFLTVVVCSISLIQSLSAVNFSVLHKTKTTGFADYAPLAALLECKPTHKRKPSDEIKPPVYIDITDTLSGMNK